MNPFPLILSSPSGVGKTTVARRLLNRRPDIGYSVSATTRSPRPGEVSGRDYHFLERAQFEARRDRQEFAEWAEVHGNLYGTLRSEVDRVLGANQHVLMDIDIKGTQQFVGSYPQSVLVFLLPPSADALLERLIGRSTESAAELATRIQAAREELRAAVLYEYIVVNDDIERACTAISSIIDAETVRHSRLPRLAHDVNGLISAIDRHLTQLSTPL